MAFRIVEGVPGSGKTYYIVHWLATTCCAELKKGGYVLDPSKNIRVITNVAGLQIPHEDFRTALDDAGGFEVFFTKEYQTEFSAGCKLVYILDEAQEWFRPRHCKLTHENLIYFEWARHQGHDLWLLTQNLRKLDFEVACLSEVVVQAQPRSNQIATELTYIDRTIDGTELRTYRLVFSKKIGSLYKSEEQTESVKIKNHRMRKYLVALLVVSILSFFSFRSTYRFWNHFMHPEKEAAAKSSATTPAAQQAAPSSANSTSATSSFSPVASAQTAVSSATKPDQPQVEYYMYRLDHALGKNGLRFLLGISWMSAQDFPYPIIKKGTVYFAMIPALLLPALDGNARALPIRTKPDKG